MNIFIQPKNNRKTTLGRKRQQILSEPARIKIGTYLTNSGQLKNKYKNNPNARVIKTIFHVTTR